MLIFDRSDSQFPYLEAGVEAAKVLVDQLSPSDEMAIVTDDVELAIPSTAEKKRLRKTLDALKNLSLKGYRTRSLQFSALLATLRELIDSGRKRPIIIFQTDGDEAARWDHQRPSSYDMTTVYSEVERSRAKIYTVIPGVRLTGVPEGEIAGRLSLITEQGRRARTKHKDMWYGAERLPPEVDRYSPPPAAEGLRARILAMMSSNLIKGQTAAARVADLTGGWTSFLENADRAGEIYGRILADTNHRYVISYYPTNN